METLASRQARSPSSRMNVIDLLAGLGDHLFDARGMNAAIENQLGERHARDLAAHRIESRQDDGLWRIVDDEVDAGGALECADVAALAPDDAALHLVIGQRHNGDGDIGDLIGGAALNGEGDDLARPGFGFLAGAHLDLAGADGCLTAGGFFDSGNQFGARLINGHARHPLQIGGSLVAQGIHSRKPLFQFLISLSQSSFLALQVFYFSVEGLLLLLKPLLLSLDFLSAFACFGFDGCPHFGGLVSSIQ